MRIGHSLGLGEQDAHRDSSISRPTVICSRRLEEAALAQILVSRLPGAGLLVVDCDLRLAVVDGDIYDTLGYTDCVGRLVRDVIPAAAWRVLAPRYQAALDGQVQSFEYEAVCRPSVHLTRMAPILDGTEVVGVMVLTEDITAKKAASKRLADSERLQRSALEVLDEGVIIVDPEGRLTQANSAACAILGTTFSSERGETDWWRPFRARRSSDGSPLNVGAGVLKTGRRMLDLDIDVTRPDGTRASLLVNHRPLRDEEGGTTGLVIAFRDVTERDEEHRRLVESQERLRAAHLVARLASWEWRPDTDEMTIFQALPGDDALMGARVPFDDLLQQVPAHERPAARKDLAAIVRGDRDDTIRLSSREGPSGPIWLETRSRGVRGVDGRVSCVRGTTQDVTEQVAQQEVAQQEATRARDFFQATLDSLSAHIAVLDDHGGILMTNRAWAEFALANDGTPVIPGDNYLEACDRAVGDQWADQAATGLRAIMSGEQTELSLEYPCDSPVASRWFTLHAARFDGPGDGRVVVSHEDVTVRRQAEDKVATQVALLDEVDAAVVGHGPDGRVTYWNRGAEQLYGWTSAEMIGAVGLVSPPDTDGAANYLEELSASGRAQSEFPLRRKDGSTVPVSVRGKLTSDATGRPTGRISVSVDVSERVASERALASARNYMQAVADSIGEGLFTLDTKGRLIYMNAAAEQLLGWSTDDLRGLVMHEIVHAHHRSETPIEDCPILRARRDRQTVRVDEDLFYRGDCRPLPVAYTASPFETEDGVEGCVVVFEDISERKAHEDNLQREADKLAWIRRIQEALTEDHFVLYGQPIVDLATSEVVQTEMLLRMREPDGETIGPGSFLPVAERYGLIGEIDRWVIERGARIAAAGRPVEINLSAHSLGDQAVLDHIEACIRNSGADPARIVFEVTETAIVEDVAAARLFANRLRTLGCKLALDDFGTGYGGFTYIKQLPIDYLKIDIEFVRDLVTNPGSRHVVEAVVSLAHGFDLQTVAEGVEDAETFDLLRELGVDFAQGYHIAGPGPLEALTASGDWERDVAPIGE